jgi:hypothetical protein
MSEGKAGGALKFLHYRGGARSGYFAAREAWRKRPGLRLEGDKPQRRGGDVMTQWGKGTGFISAVLMLSVLAGSPAQSQQPSPEQVIAIRSSCRSDFMARCAGVTPGGADALACLRKNVAQLTPGCQAAVKASSPRPAPAAAAPALAPAPTAPVSVTATPPQEPPPRAPAAVPTAAPAPQAVALQATAPAGVPSSDQVAAIRAACPTDFATYCAGVPPGGLEGLSCLQRNAAKLSAPCRFAVTPSGMAAPAQTATPAPAAPAAKPQTPRRAAAPAAAPPPAQRAAAATPAAAAPARPTADQQAAIRASCRSDFMSRCSGVQPGGADALACLKRNEAQLSSACRSAVGAIGSSAAAPTTAATPAAPTAAQQSAIKSACQRDFMMNCRGVQPGGQEAFMCLQRNSSRLSPGCQGALTAVASGTTPVAAAPAPAARPPGLFPVRRAIRERLMGN